MELEKPELTSASVSSEQAYAQMFAGIKQAQVIIVRGSLADTPTVSTVSIATRRDSGDNTSTTEGSCEPARTNRIRELFAENCVYLD